MKVCDIFEKTTKEDDDLSYEIGTIEDYIISYTASPGDLKRAVEKLLRVPEYRYRGNMYRFIAVEGKDVIKAPNTQRMLSVLHNYDKRKRGKYLYQSWVPTMKSMRRVFINNTDAEIYDNFYHPTFFVLKQRGLALDTHKLPIEIPPVYAGENELLAPLYNNVHLIGFFEGMRFFPFKKFKEYLSTLKQNLKERKSEDYYW